jgi:cell fate (sporulation/competence/biofilm development) regulator YmcA (YheA/YmcA/DUF963 family)
MQWIRDFLTKRKRNNISKKIERLQQEALFYQRNGKLRLYASAMAEIDKLAEELTDESR